MVTVSHGRPTAVTDGEAAAGAVALSEGEAALLTAIRRDFVGNEARQATAAGAAAVPLVATLSELADAADRGKGRLTSNHEHELLDRAGLSLRVPPIWSSANDQGLYAFYSYQQAMLRTIAAADSDHEIQLPDGERARRALRYVGAELIADRRLETEAATAETEGEATDESGIDTDDERLTELLESVGFDPDTDPQAVVEWIDDTLEHGRESYIAARSGSDPATEREDLRETRYELNRRIHWLGLQVEDSDDEDEEPAMPDPADGVLGYDWVRTGDHRWSGRPLRGLLYAVLTESDRLDLPDDSVDRIELINYGDVSVHAYEVPTERPDITFLRGDEPAGDPDHIDRHAVDFRAVGDFSGLGRLTTETVENAIKQHLNMFQLLARYDDSIERAPPTTAGAGDDRAAAATASADDGSTDGAGSAGMTDEAASRREDAQLETPFDDLVPDGLREAMDKVHDGTRYGEYENEAYLSDGEIVGTSHSWETGR